ncbi:hypothetical protein DIT68_13890 [Brumimicrobium oceani]|uniref:Lipocalin-like domain-containing protein n=1 Tax=Brumimicrobium oceani TaxID=2100725 RepID=A0A2U2X367_9FLAO|nr:hypothetical protein DIT68_13890 [Brumimicrobium oceani]
MKYEAGPSITIYTKKFRITGEWEKELYYSSAGEEYETDGIQKMEIYRDGVITYFEDSTEITGNWEFIKDKEEIYITNDLFNPTSYKTFKIKKLRNKEMLLEDEFGESRRFFK